MSIEQVTFQPSLYVNNMGLTRTGNKTVSVGSGACRDSTNVLDIIFNAAIAVDGTIVGANGLDSGALAANTWYAVFAIADLQGFKPPATILSTSYTSPTMPYGYGAIRRIGFVQTDASANFLNFRQVGNENYRFYQWDALINVLNGGVANSFTALNIIRSTPTSVSPVYLRTLYTSITLTNTASIRPTGSSAAANVSPIILAASVTVGNLSANMTKLIPGISSGHPSIDYIVGTADILSIWTAAFDDYL